MQILFYILYLLCLSLLLVPGTVLPIRCLVTEARVFVCEQVAQSRL